MYGRKILHRTLRGGNCIFVMFVSRPSGIYKFRKREDVIPYHQFAEDQFEKLRTDKKFTAWFKDHGYFEPSSSSPENLNKNNLEQTTIVSIAK